MHSNSGFIKTTKSPRFSFEEAQERIQSHKKKSSKRIAKRRDFESQD